VTENEKSVGGPLRELDKLDLLILIILKSARRPCLARER
jgi:hypothetical protein